MALSREAVAAAVQGFPRRRPDEEPGRHASVCVLLVPGDPDPAFVLTRRCAGLRGHAGQWALPGGRLDPGETTRQAALRELAEELGVQVDERHVLGELDDYVTRSGYRITPTVVWAADAPFEPAPNQDEVASVHVVPVRSLAVPPRFLTIPESDRPVIQVPLLGGYVHAPTGAILHQFGELVLFGRPTRVDHLEQPVFAWR